jgi:HEPN domain-containing protein
MRAAALSDYAVESRYPGLAEPVTQEEYEEATTLAEEVVRWAQGIIP